MSFEKWTLSNDLFDAYNVLASNIDETGIRT